MSTARYFVLDIEDPAEAGGLKSFGPRPAGLESIKKRSERTLKVSALKVGSAELTPSEVALERKAPGRVMERAFPIRLIKPMGEPVPQSAKAGMASWGIAATGADKISRNGSGVTVAVLDTGINPNHEAFRHLGDRLVTRDFTDHGGTGFDNHGHGSHCAGTIFGGDVGGTRIGIAPGIDRALVGKVLPDNGGGDSAMLFEALQWASKEHVNIVSMSLGFDFPGMVAQLVDEGVPEDVAASNALVLFMRNLRGFDRLTGFFRASGDILIIAAAGNESRRDEDATYLISASLPSAADHVVAIGAYGRKGKSYEVAPFSNTDVAICAPGVDILSADATNDHGLTEMSGTSMACPHTAGLAALWWQKLGAIANPDSVRGAMLEGASTAKLPKDFDVAQYGRGRAMAPKS
jgi:subtilisin family serine protease